MIPGYSPAFGRPVGELAAAISESTPALGIVGERAKVVRTYLLYAEVHDPINVNQLYWTDEPLTRTAFWTTNGGEVALVESLSDPDGGTDAWSVEKGSTSINENLDLSGLNQMTDHQGNDVALRIWVMAGGGGTDDDRFDIQAKNIDQSTDLDIHTWRKIGGPGTLSISGATQARVTGLSETVWTELEVFWEAAGAGIGFAFGDALGLQMYPGGAASVTSGAKTIVFRPQVQRALQGTTKTTAVRKTEELNGPNGAPGQDVKVYVSNNGYASGTIGNVHNGAGVTIPNNTLFEAGLTDPYNVTNQMFSGRRISGVVIPGFGDVGIFNGHENFDYLSSYVWGNRPIWIFEGEKTANFEDFSMIFKGTAQGTSWDVRRFSIQLRDNQYFVDKNIQEEVYGGFDTAYRGLTSTGGVTTDGNVLDQALIGDLTVSIRCRMFVDPGNANRALFGYGKATPTVGPEEENTPYELYWDGTNDRLNYRHRYGAGLIEDLDSGDNTFTGATMADGTWKTVTIVRDDSIKTVFFYLDDVLLGSSTYANSPTGAWTPDASKLRIGEVNDRATEESVGLDLDEFRLWDRVLTLDEIKADLNRELPLTAFDDGLVEYLKLNEGTGTASFSEFDLHSRGVKTKKWISLDNVNDDLEDNSTSGISDQAAFTFRCVFWPWFDPTTNPEVVMLVQQYGRIMWDLGKLTAAFWDGSAWQVTTAGPTWERKWFYVDISWDDATESLRMYVDGVLVDSVVKTGSTIDVASTTQGIRFSRDFASNFNGNLIAEGACFSVQRTAAQILSDWNKQLVGTETGLVSYWKMDEDTGKAKDSVGSNDLDLNGASWADRDAVLGGVADTDFSWVGSGEGTSQLAGKPKPIVAGHCRHVPLILVDHRNLVYQVGVGPIDSISEVMEGGAELTPDSPAFVEDVWGVTLTSGEYVYSKTHGLVKVFSAPTYPLTANVKGDNFGASYVENAGDVVRRLATRYSRLTDTSADVDTSTFDDLAIAAPEVVGAYVGTRPVNLLRVLTELMHSIHGVWYMDRSGKLTALQLTDPSTAAPSSTITELDFQQGSLARLSTNPPFWQQKVGWGRNWTTFDRAAVNPSITIPAGSTIEEATDDLIQEFRFYTFEDKPLQDVYLNSSDVTVTTLLYNEEDGKAESEARGALFSVPRHFYDLSLISGFFLYDIGDVVELKVPRFGLDNGRNMVVVGWEEDVRSTWVNMRLWG